MPTVHAPRIVSTSWGLIEMTLSADGLTGCTLPWIDAPPVESFEVLDAGSDAYSSYVFDLFAGAAPQRPSIGHLSGTPFQVRVWQGLMTIPTGETRTYRELAAVIGCPQAVRAVANACGRNPAPLFVPCHRVIRTDGTLGGFSSGLAWKRLLLAAEQSNR